MAQLVYGLASLEVLAWLEGSVATVVGWAGLAKLGSQELNWWTLATVPTLYYPCQIAASIWSDNPERFHFCYTSEFSVPWPRDHAGGVQESHNGHHFQHRAFPRHWASGLQTNNRIEAGKH